MSHIIEQVKSKQQQSHSDNRQDTQDSKDPQKRSAVLFLTDSDYEFLFNQLLEGIAHGWHQKQIVKFFQRLEKRGKPEHWVAWLKRFEPKVLDMPNTSKRQLGVMMIRLGELSLAERKIEPIGAVSYQIGRKLLFENHREVVWEYDGPDLLEIQDEPIETETSREDEQTLSDRLPTEFSKLGAGLGNKPNSPTISETADNEERARLEQWQSQSHPASEPNISPTVEPLEAAQPDTSPAVESLEAAQPNTSPTVEPPEEISLTTSATDLPQPPTVIPSSSLESSSSEKNSAPSDTDAIATDNTTLPLESIAPARLETNVPSLEREPTGSETAINNQSHNLDWQKFIELIQQDEELVTQISQKLNISPSDSKILADTASQQLKTAKPNPPKQSVAELVESWFNLGLKQASAEEFENAIASWQKALEIDPNLSEAWHNQGSALGRLGKYEAAIASFERALTIAPHNCQAWIDRAHALYQLQKWSEAVASWDKALELMPGNHLLWYNRGCALEQLKDIAAAIASQEKALEIRPDFQPARSRYINLIADRPGSN